MEEFQSKCFDISGELEPNDAEPLTGEEYLQRVIWENNRTPNVVTADIDYSKIKSKPPSKKYFSLPPKLSTCKIELLPNSQWEKDFLYDFSEYRQQLRYNISNYQNHKLNRTNFPHINDKKSWYIFCFGKSEQTNTLLKDENMLIEEDDNSDNSEDYIVDLDDESVDSMDDDYDSMNDIQNKITKFHIEPNSTTNINGNLPDISIISHFDHLMTVGLINYHIEWFENKDLTNERSQWLYILLSLLEKPIDPNTSASLRSLMRRLANLRSKIDSTNHPLLPSINVLITIVGKYFNQHDPNE